MDGTGESMAPLYRDGDVLIVSPNSAPRKGDRVVLRALDGEVMAKMLVRCAAKTVELAIPSTRTIPISCFPWSGSTGSPASSGRANRAPLNPPRISARIAIMSLASRTAAQIIGASGNDRAKADPERETV